MGLFGKKKNKEVGKLAETAIVSSRADDARSLEQKKLAKKREIEKLMADFAKESGEKSYKARKYKVGEAPNDWKEEVK